MREERGMGGWNDNKSRRRKSALIVKRRSISSLRQGLMGGEKEHKSKTRYKNSARLHGAEIRGSTEKDNAVWEVITDGD